MRIVYDYAGQGAHIPAAVSPRARVSRESVIIVHIGKDTAGDSRGQNGPNGAGRAESGRWKTSDEALARDREVRGHEFAHLSALGPYAASGILYSTVKGADGESLAVGGSIAVDLTAVPGDPAATIRKARIVLNAAQAPGDPSAADMRVAARAYRLMQAAQSELSVDRFA